MSDKVFANGQEITSEASPSSVTAKGRAIGLRDKSRFAAFSMDVQVEGKSVARRLEATTPKPSSNP
jgi:hypothetical protein